MSISINNNLQAPVYQSVAQKSKAEAGTFSIPITSTDDFEKMSLSEIFKADTGQEPDLTNGAFQKEWLSRVMQLPEGWMTDEQLMKYHESKSAPIIYNFSELYEKFGIELIWTYNEDGTRKCAMYDDNPRNRAALIRMNAYMNSIADQHIKAGNRFVTPPNRDWRGA